MQKLEQYHLMNRRNSSIELLKVFGMVLIVLSHVIQTLHNPKEYIPVTDYIVDLSRATTDIQQLVLVLFRHCGVLGNSIFFICSAWFLLDSDSINKKKILQMIMDVWFISVCVLIAVYIIRNGNLDRKIIVKQILPVTFGNNWYISCYVLFYLIHPFLNWFIKKMEQKTLLKVNCVLLSLYVGANYILPGCFFSSNIVFWITVYFAIAYMKYFLVDLSDNIRINLLLVAIGLVGNIGIVLLTNFLGLHYDIFSDMLLYWNSNYSPFLLLMAVGMLNIARNMHFNSKKVNYISGLSILIYLFHENQLLRTYYRPLMWHYIYNHFGYDYVLAWALILTVIVFSFGLIASILYKCTMQRFTISVSNWLIGKLQRIYNKIEKRILQFH